MSAISSVQGLSKVILSKAFVTLPTPQTNDELQNQTIIVTGSNTGLGLEASRHLLRLGVGKLIMAVRNQSKGEAAKQQLLASTHRDDSTVEVWPLDMDSYDSIKSFASLASQLCRIDAVLANAGIMTSKFSLSEGNERTLTVNVLGTFLLCMLLAPKLRQSSLQTGIIPRFVIPNSTLHYLAPLKELDPEKDMIPGLNDPDRANMAGRYPLSKLLVLYGVREVAERNKHFAGKGEGAFIINSPNPSYCKSNLASESTGVGVQVMEKVLARSTEEGSRALVHAVLSGEESNGQYLDNCQVSA